VRQVAVLVEVHGPGANATINANLGRFRPFFGDFDRFWGISVNIWRFRPIFVDFDRFSAKEMTKYKKHVMILFFCIKWL
jgi:hypothetical protein